MTGREKDPLEGRLLLRSQLCDLAQLPPWIECLASRHSIPENVEYAINLCLEEAVSNIIRHGYGDYTGGSVVVRFTMPGPDSFVFIIEDEAQPFNPLNAPALDSREEVRVGGKGIHFLRRFADDLGYESMPSGNRLKIVFSAVSSEL
jgi:anti-sigma regulatory factor (Ser/Thr protein kinase)